MPSIRPSTTRASGPALPNVMRCSAFPHRIMDRRALYWLQPTVPEWWNNDRETRVIDLPGFPYGPMWINRGLTEDSIRGSTHLDGTSLGCESVDWPSPKASSKLSPSASAMRGDACGP